TGPRRCRRDPRAPCAEPFGSRRPPTPPTPPPHATAKPWVLDVEPDLEDVAVLDLIVLAFYPKSPALLGLLPRADLDELLVGDDLGADEAPLQVGVDHTRGLRGFGAGPERPGA